ncbi:hypothetical protein CHUAL_009250 [Chamberlinius hualienensis]
MNLISNTTKVLKSSRIVNYLFCSFLSNRKCSNTAQLHNFTETSSLLTRRLVINPTTFQILDRSYSSDRSSHKDKKSKKDGKGKVFLSDDELSQVINVENFKKQLSRTVDKLKEEYVKNLSLRTSAGAIESLKIQCDDEEYTLNELAQVSRKNPKLIVLNMVNFPQTIPAVLDAISKSGFNLNPQQEGTTIYIPIPPLTREHRENLSKSARTLFVKTNDELRDIQNDIIRKMKRQKCDFSEDLIYNAQQQVSIV